MSYTKYTLFIDVHTNNTDEKDQVIAMLNRIIGEFSSLELHSSVQISQTKEVDPGMDTHERTGDGRSGSCFPELSVRQQEIAILLAANYSVQKIAKQLFLSENTIRKHIQNIKKILGIHESGVDFIYSLKSIQEEVRNRI